MSPINEGEVAYAVRNLTAHAAQTMDDIVRAELREAKRRDDRARTLTDIAFREFHAEAFGTYQGHELPTYAQHAMARLVFGVPDLTETPVDRFMAGWRRTH